MLSVIDWFLLYSNTDGDIIKNNFKMPWKTISKRVIFVPFRWRTNTGKMRGAAALLLLRGIPEVYILCIATTHLPTVPVLASEPMARYLNLTLYFSDAFYAC